MIKLNNSGATFTRATAIYRNPPIKVDSARAAPVRTLGGPKTSLSPLVRRYIK